MRNSKPLFQKSQHFNAIKYNECKYDKKVVNLSNIGLLYFC